MRSTRSARRRCPPVSTFRDRPTSESLVEDNPSNDENLYPATDYALVCLVQVAAGSYTRCTRDSVLLTDPDATSVLDLSDMLTLLMVRQIAL